MNELIRFRRMREGIDRQIAETKRRALRCGIDPIEAIKIMLRH
jgi:hypothetical protein